MKSRFIIIIGIIVAAKIIVGGIALMTGDQKTDVPVTTKAIASEKSPDGAMAKPLDPAPDDSAAEDRKETLKIIGSELDAKIEELKRLRDEIRAEREKQKLAEDKSLKHLIKVYSAMKPQVAASLLEKMDTELVIEIFSKMKGDAVGSIMSYINVEKAARISEGLLKKK